MDVTSIVIFSNAKLEDSAKVYSFIEKIGCVPHNVTPYELGGRQMQSIQAHVVDNTAYSDYVNNPAPLNEKYSCLFEDASEEEADNSNSAETTDEGAGTSEDISDTADEDEDEDSYSVDSDDEEDY